MHRLAEEEAAQRILKEQEKAVGKKDDRGGFSVMGVAEDTPINMAELSMEEQVRSCSIEINQATRFVQYIIFLLMMLCISHIKCLGERFF